MKTDTEKQKTSHTAEDSLYMAGWCILVLAVMITAIKRICFPDFQISAYMRPCMFHSLTGYFCPGCGGTRAVEALFQGHFLVSAADYPLLMYTVIMYVIFMATQTIERLSAGSVPVGLKWKNAYLWIACAILAVQCAGKNLFYMMTGIQPFLS